MRVTPDHAGTEDAVIKGLFSRLVRAVGGVDAAGAYLGITHQRVSQITKTHTHFEGDAPVADKQQRDMPTWGQVTALEAVCGIAVVTGELARAAKGEAICADPVKEAGDVIINATALFDMVREKADPKAIQAAIVEHEREVNELKDSLRGGVA